MISASKLPRYNNALVLAVKAQQHKAQPLALASTASAWETYDPYGNQRRNNPNYQQDSWGNYTRQENMYKDNDRDGIVNRYDYNDNNPNVQRRGQYSNSYGGSGNIYGNQPNTGSQHRRPHPNDGGIFTPSS